MMPEDLERCVATAVASAVTSADAGDAAAVERALADPQHAAHAAMQHIAMACMSPDESQRSAGIRALFAGVVETLNDRLDAPGRSASSRLFAQAAWLAAQHEPELLAALREDGIASLADLLQRHARVRAGRDAWPTTAQRIAVLSRVTVGADIQISSVIIQRLRQQFPNAEIVLIGDGKLAGLFAFPGVSVRHVAYVRRGGLGERLRAWLAVRAACADCDLVLSPDSRLDQLGLFPTHRDPARHRLWENLQPPAQPAQPLATLADAWCSAQLGHGHAQPMMALSEPYRALATRMRAALGAGRWCAVKLDHGGNAAKALPQRAEISWLAGLRAAGWNVLLDRGFGAAELAASDALCAAAGLAPLDVDEGGTQGLSTDALKPASLSTAGVVRFHGSIAGWAAAVSACSRALSYDSVGQHLAAALGVEVVVPFTGYAHAAFITAWTPVGRARVQVIPIAPEQRDDPQVHAAVLNALTM